LQESRQIWSVRRLLDWSVNYFKSKEIPHPKLSAELLLAAVLNNTRMELYLNFDRILNKNELAKYRAFVLKRAEYMPVQYILNKAHFRKIDLYVDENVLIPRPETELLVDEVLKHCIKFFEYMEKQDSGEDRSLKILEIGTGSGAVSISLAREIFGLLEKKSGNKKNLQDDNENIKTGPESLQRDFDWSIAATEVSKKGIEVAKRNAKKLLDDEELKKVNFFCADIIPENNGKFLNQYCGKINIVVSNPPYIRSADYEKLPREVRQYEPREALLAGETGLEIYKKIIESISTIMSDKFCIYIFETDPAISLQVKGLLSEKLAAEEIIIEKDYNDRDRIITARVFKC